jgi:heme exporter protein C
LLKEDVKYDVLAMTSVVIGVVYGVASITTGMLWANEVWGAPWNWDPRQTATLVLFLAYVGYIALRGSISDVDRMRVFSATYGIAAFVTLPISYISAVLFRSLHTQLPGQPLGPEAHILLGVRVIVSFTVYILLQHLYYTKVKNRVESSMEV